MTDGLEQGAAAARFAAGVAAAQGSAESVAT